MSNKYGTRFLLVEDFIKYCKDLNINTDSSELEYYEKERIMLPSLRLIYPKEYVEYEFLWPRGEIEKRPSLEKWPEFKRLFEKNRVLLKDYSDLKDCELVDAFDREKWDNPYLLNPETEPFKPWVEYEILIKSKDNNIYHRSFAKHYYCYWQVYQLAYINEYPDLYENLVYLKILSDEQKKKLRRPNNPNLENINTFQGNIDNYDALSYWITMDQREQKRAFSQVPEKFQVQTLNDNQYNEYLSRLKHNSKHVKEKFGIDIEQAFKFLYFLIDLHMKYIRLEKIKLSEETEKDIYYLSYLIGQMFNQEGEGIETELKNRYPYWYSRHFRHLNTYLKERDYAFDLLNNYAEAYPNKLKRKNIDANNISFCSDEINSLLDYCENEGLTILASSLSGMIASGDEYNMKFERKAKYTNMKNILTSLEYLLKNIAEKSNIEINNGSLTHVINKVMQNEEWIDIYWGEVSKGNTNAKNTAQFYRKLTSLVNNQALKVNGNTFCAREFLITSLARNLTVHNFPDANWFYGDLFGEILDSAIFSLLYSWKVAKSNLGI